MQKSFEDLAVLFAVLIICRVERNWSLVMWHVVVGLLPRGQMAERVSKEIFFTVAGDDVLTMVRRGRAVSWKHRTHDYTKGFSRRGRVTTFMKLCVMHLNVCANFLFTHFLVLLILGSS